MVCHNKEYCNNNMLDYFNWNNIINNVIIVIMLNNCRRDKQCCRKQDHIYIKWISSYHKNYDIKGNANADVIYDEKGKPITDAVRNIERITNDIRNINGSVITDVINEVQWRMLWEMFI